MRDDAHRLSSVLKINSLSFNLTSESDQMSASLARIDFTSTRTNESNGRPPSLHGKDCFSIDLQSIMYLEMALMIHPFDRTALLPFAFSSSAALMSLRETKFLSYIVDKINLFVLS